MKKRIEAQKRHEMRRSGAPSARNLDRESFIKAWGPELRKQGRDAEYLRIRSLVAELTADASGQRTARGSQRRGYSMVSSMDICGICSHVSCVER